MNRLRELRVAKGKTQAQLSDELDIPQNTLSQYELGRRNPSLSIWKKFAEYFDTSIDYVSGRGVNRVQKIREGHGESQELLAAELGLTRQAISLYETGNRKMSIDTAIRLADHYGVSLDYLVGRTFGQHSIDNNKKDVSAGTDNV